MQRRLADAGVAAGALVIVRDGKLDYSGGFGVANGPPVDPATAVFHAASNSKTMVAVAVMQLVAQGRLDLHADINRYLKGFSVPAAFDAPVTLDGLLTHSAGFDDHFLGALAAQPSDLVPLGDYLATHLPSRVFPPGQRIVYSNHGIALAALVVEDVTGEDFASYAQHHIFDLLGMGSSSFVQPPPPGIVERLVRDPRGDPPSLIPYPAGSLVSTPLDMGRFIASQLGSPLEPGTPLLPDASRLAMLQQHFTPAAGMPGAAYGYFEGEANGLRSLHHTGDGGDHSLLYLVPEANLGFYLVYTTPQRGATSAPRELIAQDLLDLYLPTDHRFTQPAPPRDFASRADRYAGTYRINTYARHTIEKLGALGQEITITNPGDGTLAADLGGGQPIRLVATSSTLFRDPDGAYIAFHADDHGDITGMSFTGAAVDDPGSAERLHWWETTNAALTCALVIAALATLRIGTGIVLGIRGRRLSQRLAPSLSWRLSGWILGVLAAAAVLGVASIVTARGVVTALPLGVRLALLLVNIAAAAGLVLVPLSAHALLRRRGPLVQRILLGPIAASVIVAVPLLAYWNVLGLHY